MKRHAVFNAIQRSRIILALLSLMVALAVLLPA